jgi:hypothetical protein
MRRMDAGWTPWADVGWCMDERSDGWVKRGRGVRARLDGESNLTHITKNSHLIIHYGPF